jgi:hypothetical protein
VQKKEYRKAGRELPRAGGNATVRERGKRAVSLTIITRPIATLVHTRVSARKETKTREDFTLTRSVFVSN